MRLKEASWEVVRLNGVRLNDDLALPSWLDLSASAGAGEPSIRSELSSKTASGVTMIALCAFLLAAGGAIGSALLSGADSLVRTATGILLHALSHGAVASEGKAVHGRHEFRGCSISTFGEEVGRSGATSGDGSRRNEP
mmetsp:Transcript_49692/g.123530  ORF Transcript_49692/g.123530 Transcript_49692/m.123530 type:complete len:139 (-) Transcript_49692:403-819(-)